MRSYKNKGVACGGSAPLRLRGRGAVGVGRGGSGDRRTAPEGPWEPGLRRVPRTDPKESSSHRDASSCRPVQRGHLLVSLKGAPRPPRAGRMGGAERQHGQIRGAAPACVSTSLSSPLSLSFPAVFLSSSLSRSLFLCLFFSVSLCLCFPCLSLPISLSPSLPPRPNPPILPSPPGPPSPCNTSSSAPLCTPALRSAHAPFGPRTGSDGTSEAPASHHIRPKCLTITGSRITCGHHQTSARRLLGAWAGPTPWPLVWPTQAAGQSTTQGLALRRISQRRGAGGTHPKIYLLHGLVRSELVPSGR